MMVLSESTLFGRASVPLTVWEQTARSPSGTVRAEAVKVVYVISGWAEVTASSESVFVEPGTILTIPAGLECSGYPQGHTRTVTFYLQPEFLAGELRWLPREHPLVHQLRRGLQGASGFGRLQLPREAMRELAPQLVRMANLKPDGNEFVMLSMASDIANIIGHVSGATRPALLAVQSSVPLPRREVRAAVALLREYPDRPWAVDELAHQVALSSSQLSRLFRDQVGLSPASYLRTVRADRMAELLASWTMGVVEAARAAGWENPTVASRAFKRRYGVSPRTYAAAHAGSVTIAATA